MEDVALQRARREVAVSGLSHDKFRFGSALVGNGRGGVCGGAWRQVGAWVVLDDSQGCGHR